MENLMVLRWKISLDALRMPIKHLFFKMFQSIGFGAFSRRISWCRRPRFCCRSWYRNVIFKNTFFILLSASEYFIAFRWLQMIYLMNNTYRFVGVKATTSFYTKEVTEEVPPAKRQCLAEGEKKLKYFPHYSRSACFVECDTQLMEKRCQCRPFFFRGKKL